MKLKDIAEIRSGYPFRGRIEPQVNGALRVIQIKDINEGQSLAKADLVTVNLERDPQAYSVKEGDVLFLSRGHRLFATPITEPLKNTIATYYFFVLRPKTGSVNPRYLAWYINQPPVQTELNAAKRGSHMPLVSRNDIEELHVEIPPLRTQQAIVELSELGRREAELLAAIQEKRTGLINSICLQAAHQPS